jgi:anthranilate synthase component 2
MLSPGPGTPDQAGVSMATIQALAGIKPVFGVCLGQQSIGQVYGGKIIHAREIMHGKTSPVCHSGLGVFAGIENPFTVTRYHSLVVERDSLPDCLEITAWTEDEHGEIDEIMGLRHRQFAVEGVQFHPESILTEHGYALLQNFLEQISAGHS